MVSEALFGAPWAQVERPHVEAFLDTAGDEGLTWEVKGDRRGERWPRPEQAYDPVCAFGNSFDGGVLIVGAEQRKRQPGRGSEIGWDLVGLTPPAGEIPLWLANQYSTNSGAERGKKSGLPDPAKTRQRTPPKGRREDLSRGRM